MKMQPRQIKGTTITTGDTLRHTPVHRKQKKVNIKNKNIPNEDIS